MKGTKKKSKFKPSQQQQLPLLPQLQQQQDLLSSHPSIGHEEVEHGYDALRENGHVRLWYPKSDHSAT